MQILDVGAHFALRQQQAEAGDLGEEVEGDLGEVAGPFAAGLEHETEPVGVVGLGLEDALLNLPDGCLVGAEPEREGAPAFELVEGAEVVLEAGERGDGLRPLRRGDAAE